jgi:ribonucleotide reductase beta subunit family protein with ferritin-like domain
MEFRKVSHYFRENKLSLHLDLKKFMLFSSNKTVQNLDIEHFFSNSSPNVEDVSPNFLHKMEQAHSFFTSQKCIFSVLIPFQQF